MPQLKSLRVRLPVVPDKFIAKEILDYLASLNSILRKYFDDSELVLADSNLIGNNVIQNLAAAFTINPNAFFIDMYSTAAVTSNTTTAIKDGLRNQRIVLCNRGTNNITIAHDANTKLNASVNNAITPDGSLTLRWGGSYWFELGRSNP